MKWLSGIWQVILTLPTTTKTVAVFMIIFLTAGYFFFDRYFDYRQAVDLDQPKRETIKNNPMKEYGVSFYELSTEYNGIDKPKKAK